MAHEAMAQIAQAHDTISGKARALTDAGYSISEIHKFLNRSYQQIRQVVKDYEARKLRLGDRGDGGRSDAADPAPIAVPPPSIGPSHARPAFRLQVHEDGTLSLPRHVLESSGISAGEVVVGLTEGDQLLILPASVSMRRAQDLVQALIPGGQSLADSLIADRRREAEQEHEGG